MWGPLALKIGYLVDLLAGRLVLESDTRTIGLVGGIGPGATMRYYDRLVAGIEEHQRRPAIILSHADALRVRALLIEENHEALSAYLASHLNVLVKAGATVAAMTAIAPYACIADLRQRTAVPVLDPIDCIRSELDGRGIRRVGILGTRFVMQTALFGRLQGVDVIPLSSASLDFVHHNYLKIATARGARNSGADIDGIRSVARTLIAQGAEIVILAGTDLSLAFSDDDFGFPALDASDLHVAALVRAVVSAPAL